MSPPSWLLAASNLGATRRSSAWDIPRVGTSRSCPRSITFANMLWPVGWRATAYDHCPLHSCSRHHGCREPLFRLAKQGLSQISGRRILRVIGHLVLSLSRRCFGASFGDKFYRDTSDQRWPLHSPFHPLLALFLFWLRQEAKSLNRTPSHVPKIRTAKPHALG